MDPTLDDILYDFVAGCSTIPTLDDIFYDYEAGLMGNPRVFSTTPFQLLKKYGTKRKHMHVKEKTTQQMSTDPPCHDESRSATTIMKLARSRLQDLKTENPDDLYHLLKTNHGVQLQPDRIMTFDEEIELAVSLQAVGQQVGKKRFISATKLLTRCKHSASKTGTALQRIVYYFAQALEQKIDKEWGLITPDGNHGMGEENRKAMDVVQTLTTLQPARMSCEQQLITSVVCQYTSIQSILDNVAFSKRVHLIDLSIKNGSHWTVLIQALSVRYECPVEHLKITAVGTSNKLLEETGKRLSAFAESLNVPFSYNVVLSDLKEIKKEMFKVEFNETLSIHVSKCLWTVLAWPAELENLISVVKGLNPCLLVIHEIDANLNSTDFVERFQENLFFFSVIFDGLMIKFKNHPFRNLTEENLYRGQIRNTITCDGTEWTYRHESVRFWRSLFKRSGFVEAELSPTALLQAKFLLERSVNHSDLHLQTDGKCLTSWLTGIPLDFVSTWKLI